MSKKPIKAPASAGEVIFGLFPGLVFLTMSMADCSFHTLIYQEEKINFEFIKLYLNWRAEAPYFVSLDEKEERGIG